MNVRFFGTSREARQENCARRIRHPPQNAFVSGRGLMDRHFRLDKHFVT